MKVCNDNMYTYVYVTGSAKTLHVSMQILTHFRTSKCHNSLTISCYVVEICILVDK